MAGGEEFQLQTGVSKEVKELAISIGTSIAAKAIGAMCSRRRKLPAEGEEGEDEHAEQEEDKLSEKEPSEFEMKNMSPNTDIEGRGSHPSPKIGAGLVTPQADPERHDLTLSHQENPLGNIRKQFRADDGHDDEHRPEKGPDRKLPKES